MEKKKINKNGRTGRQSTDIIFTERKGGGKTLHVHLRPNPVALCVRTATADAAAAVRDIPPDAHRLNSRRHDAPQRDDVDDEKKRSG
jgi:hypothetical protein